MKSESRVCQNCKSSFTIEAEDFTFYERIKVPPPTWCPECRMIRRMTWRNERNLYKRKDDFGNEVISIYSADKPLKVYERGYWWSDKWDPMDYGRDYDFSRPFFQQFRELMLEVPAVAVFNSNPVNSDYCNHSGYMKDSYLAFASWECERVLYSDLTLFSKDSMELYAVDKSELCYEVVESSDSYKLFFSQQCVSCSESYFLFDCRNCHNCFGCAGLRNKQYYIFNKPYAKEEYEKKLASFNLSGFKSIQSISERLQELKFSTPVKFARVTKTTNSTGNNIHNIKNCFNCFDLKEAENCKYLSHGFNIKDSYDGFGIGLCELLYEGIDTGLKGASRQRFSIVVYASSDTHYCFNCEGSHSLFGCVGLRNKEYCILNKQYSKEDYGKMLERIIHQMNEVPYRDKKGKLYKYGDFFPAELSPFAYNETIAQRYYPLKKEDTLVSGHSWKDSEEKNYKITLDSKNLPDSIKEVDDLVLKETIGCMHDGKCNEQCTSAFKIIPGELEFYRKTNLPLPRLCPNCRFSKRFSLAQPLKLWHRRCYCAGEKSENAVYQNQAAHFHGSNHCPNEFETSYAPDRPEIVYCEQCYQAEVV